MEKWEEERQEKEKELHDVRHRLEEQRREGEEEVKALLEKQAAAVDQVTQRLESSHKQERKDLMEKHRQEVEFAAFVYIKYCQCSRCHSSEMSVAIVLS